MDTTSRYTGRSSVALKKCCQKGQSAFNTVAKIETGATPNPTIEPSIRLPMLSAYRLMT